MLICITISTNYANILDKIIHHNQKYFDKWYIVTSETDSATIKVINDANYAHIEILYYNFNQPGCKFDKGGAVKYAQLKSLQDFEMNVPVLIIDSDIYLPDNTMEYVKNLNLKLNNIYGIKTRYVFNYYSELINCCKDEKNLSNVIKESLTQYNMLYGCFQLYLQNPTKLYKQSYNCSKCDFDFCSLFNTKNILDYSVYHLGPTGTNWDGRVSQTDFIIDEV